MNQLTAYCVLIISRQDFPAIIAAKDWELMVKETVSPRREIIMV